MLRVEKDCSLSPNDWEFYNVYSSDFNRETLEYMKYGMSLDEYLTHAEYIEVRTALEEEAKRAAEANKPKGGK